MHYNPPKITACWRLALMAFTLGIVSGMLCTHYMPLSEIVFMLRTYGQPPQIQVKKSTDVIVPTQLQGHLCIFILAGQSNMIGIGQFQPEASMPSSNIFVFDAQYRWRPAREPLFAQGGGPGLPFAKALVELQPNMVIGLVPCAVSGSSIEEWQPNRSDGSLYAECVKRARAAQLMGTIRGVLFYQGESDAQNPRINPSRILMPDNWGEHFTIFIKQFCEDLDNPELPCVFAQIGSHHAPVRLTQWQVVKDQQAAVRIPGVSMISTDDLPLYDSVHLTMDAYDTVGQRFANAMLVLLKTNGFAPEEDQY